MRTRIGILTMIGCLIAGASLLALRHRDIEPHYQGRSLSEWIILHQQTGAWAQDAGPASEALHHMGTNVLPRLLEWIRYQPSPWQKRLASKLGWLPQPLHPASVFISGEAKSKRVHLVQDGFRLLGEQASPVIPDLTLILHNAKHYTNWRSALFATASLGKPAIPLLTELLGYPDPEMRISVIRCLVYEETRFGTNINAIVTALVRCTQDHDPKVAELACEVLGTFETQTDKTVPALAAVLDTTNTIVRIVAMQTLSYLHAAARPATHSLLATLDDPDPLVRHIATNTLEAIAPEFLTNAPAR